MSTVAGNLFELRQVSGLRLTGLQLPRAFVEAYPGPPSASPAPAS
jgi:ribulose-bisphosphate carboxylase large chain